MVIYKHKYKIDYLVAGLKKEACRKTNAKLTKTIHNELKDVYPGIGCLEGIF